MPYIDYFLTPSLKQPELTKEILATTLNISKVAPKLILYGKDKRKWNKQHLKTLTLILCNVVKYHHQDGGVFLYSRQNRKKEPKLFNPNDIGYSSLFWVLDELHKAKLIEDINKVSKKDTKLFLSTINRNLHSFIFAKILAEYFLKIVPKGTHEYQKFIKPSEVSNVLELYNYKVQEVTGMVLNPITFDFQLSSFSKINYFLYATKLKK